MSMIVSPAEASAKPAHSGPSSPGLAHPGLTTIIDDLRRNNPFGTAGQLSPAFSKIPGNQVAVEVRGPSLKLTLALMLEGKGLTLADLRIKRSGAFAVATITYDLLPA